MLGTLRSAYIQHVLTLMELQKVLSQDLKYLCSKTSKLQSE